MKVCEQEIGGNKINQDAGEFKNLSKEEIIKEGKVQKKEVNRKPLTMKRHASSKTIKTKSILYSSLHDLGGW